MKSAKVKDIVDNKQRYSINSDYLRVSELRSILGLSQGVFARQIGISPALGRKLEAGAKPISEAVRTSLREVYGAVITNEGVFNLAGGIYESGLFERVREIGSARVWREEAIESLNEDVERLFRAAEKRQCLHALLPRFHRFFARAVAELGLEDEVNSVRTSATVTVGQIRAWERARPLRRRRERFLQQLRLRQIAAKAGAQVQARQNALLAEGIAQLDREIALTESKVNVQGRRRSIAWEIDGQLVIIAPDEPNETVYPRSAPPPKFAAWWDAYLRDLQSLCETPADAPGD